ncbi:hypothetical protein GWK47_009035 [Chionoecetes opilio]|uniref:CUB domain-containing protein n=1 Tax=Chionoecetes opilio TaxID=41210 RepID=A0A8J5CR25_CHIOP|nr:hypothetical protein GWK47_009035 [Chionoecetes opilio]
MKVPYALLVVAATTVGVALASELSHREERMFFASNPVVCEGNAGRTGACLPYFRCDSYGGKVEGSCSVVGQCCVVHKSCGETSPARTTYFNHNQLDIADGDTCSVTLTTSNKIAAQDICQLHVTLKRKRAEREGGGKLEGGRAEDSIKICGNGNNQMLVVDVAGLEGPFKVSVVSVEDNPDSEWEVKVVQVPCDKGDLAPSGCDQYVIGLTGEVKSFNYDTKASSRNHDNDKPGSRHLQESYTICVRPEEGYCGLKWTAPSEEEDKYAFTLTDNLAPDGSEAVFGVKVNEQCDFTDYLVVTEAHIEEDEDTTTILCGSRFPTAVFSNSFKIRVEANEKELEDEEIDNRGFHLKYEQQKC